jgi:hypothetical protein
MQFDFSDSYGLLITTELIINYYGFIWPIFILEYAPPT